MPNYPVATAPGTDFVAKIGILTLRVKLRHIGTV